MSVCEEDARDSAIREWGQNFEDTILLKPKHLHLRPATAIQQPVELNTALGGEYKMKHISECSMIFVRHLKSLCTRYPSERGERAVVKCLTSALMRRFAKGGQHRMPGLVLADIFAADKLAADHMRRSGSVEATSGQYQLSLPADESSWVSRVRIMEENKPTWPARNQFATIKQHEEAKGLVEQECWEVWTNKIEMAWGCAVHDAIPVHVCEPIIPQDDDQQRLLEYDGHNGSEFDCGGRAMDDYKGPMDWKVDFTFYLMVFSLMCADDHDLGMDIMTKAVQERLQKKGSSRKAWVTVFDLKKIVGKRSRQLDGESTGE